MESSIPNKNHGYTSKFGSFCDDHFDALATLCCGYCDESWAPQTLLHMHVTSAMNLG
jgi:hypothetical protein